MKLFSALLALHKWVISTFSFFAKVKTVTENVASMDAKSRREISQLLDIKPLRLDPANPLPYSRPRLAWLSEPAVACPGVELYETEELIHVTMQRSPLYEEQL